MSSHPLDVVYKVKYDFRSERWAVIRNHRILKWFDLKKPAKKYALKNAEQENGKYLSYAKERKDRVVASRQFSEEDDTTWWKK